MTSVLSSEFSVCPTLEHVLTGDEHVMMDELWPGRARRPMLPVAIFMSSLMQK